MWAILKIDRKKFSVLKKDLKDKLGADTIFYNPKLLIQKYKNNKLINKEFNLLGDYLFCFHTQKTRDVLRIGMIESASPANALYRPLRSWR